MISSVQRAILPRATTRPVMLICCLFSIVAVFWMTAQVIIFESAFQISVLQFTIVVLACVLYFCWAAKMVSTSFSPFLFAVLFFCGYVVTLVAIEIDVEPYITLGGGVNEVGWFSFTPEAYWRVVACACLGMFGIM